MTMNLQEIQYEIEDLNHRFDDLDTKLNMILSRLDKRLPPEEDSET